MLSLVWIHVPIYLPSFYPIPQLFSNAHKFPHTTPYSTPHTNSVASGISCPALSSSLAYYDSYRRARSPANLTQAQRDFFGAHTYNRTDRKGVFHTLWSAASTGVDVGDVKDGQT
jgi:6-phosphogluconate dehydrogenase